MEGMSIPGMIPGFLNFRDNMEWLTRCGRLTWKRPSQPAQQAPGEGQNEFLFVFHSPAGIKIPSGYQEHSQDVFPHFHVQKERGTSQRHRGEGTEWTQLEMTAQECRRATKLLSFSQTSTSELPLGSVWDGADKDNQGISSTSSQGDTSVSPARANCSR